jgi:hypothetical protein
LPESGVRPAPSARSPQPSASTQAASIEEYSAPMQELRLEAALQLRDRVREVQEDQPPPPPLDAKLLVRGTRPREDSGAQSSAG